MNARFPADLLLALDADWPTAKAALKTGLSRMGDNIQAGYGTFDSVLTLKDGGSFPYQIGTWGPIDMSGASLQFGNPVNGPRRYVRIGRMVWVNGGVSFPATASGASMVIGGLPFTPLGDKAGSGLFENYAFSVAYTDQGSAFTLDLATNVSGIFAASFAGALLTNANFSGKQLRFSGWYLAAS